LPDDIAHVRHSPAVGSTGEPGFLSAADSGKAIIENTTATVSLRHVIGAS
jgi:hypothetical protein